MTTSIPALCLKRCAVRFCVLPGLIEPNVSFPGSLCAIATTSCTLLNGELAPVANKSSSRLEMVEIWVKSFRISNGLS